MSREIFINEEIARAHSTPETALRIYVDDQLSLTSVESQFITITFPEEIFAAASEDPDPVTQSEPGEVFDEGSYVLIAQAETKEPIKVTVTPEFVFHIDPDDDESPTDMSDLDSYTLHVTVLTR